jgi:hemoglobin-like flavoprotein
MKNRFGEKFYTNLLTDYPELLDYFARADMDTLSSHIALAVDLMLLRYSEVVAEVDSVFRKTVDHLADLHRRLDIPTDAYPSIGLNTVKTLQPFFAEYVSSSENTLTPVTADELTRGLVTS